MKRQSMLQTVLMTLFGGSGSVCGRNGGNTHASRISSATCGNSERDVLIIELVRSPQIFMSAALGLETTPSRCDRKIVCIINYPT